MPKSRAHKEEMMPEAVFKMRKRMTKKTAKKKPMTYKKGGVVKRK